MEFLKMLDVLLRRKWVFASVFFSFVAMFAAGIVLISPTYQATAKLFVQSSSALSSLMSALEMPQAATNDNSEDIFETKTALGKVRPLLEELIASMKLKDRDGETMEPDDLIESTLINKLLPQPAVAIKQEEDTAILKITSTAPAAEQSAAMANKLASLYLDYNVKRTQMEFHKVKEFISRKLATLHDNYSRSLAALTEFKIAENAADLDSELESTLSRLNDLTKNHEDNEQSLVLMDKEIASVQAQLQKVGKYRKETAEFSKSNEIVSLKNKLNEMLVAISSKGLVYQKNHPEYKQLEKELDTLQQLVAAGDSITLSRENHGVDPVYDALANKLVDLQISREVSRAKRSLLLDGIAKYQKKLDDLPTKSARLAELELSLTASKSIYETFLGYLNKVAVAEAVALSDTRIVEPAEVPEKQKFPKKSVMLVLGVLLGLFWAATAAFFLEYIDNSVRSESDLRHLNRFVLLGRVPRSRRLGKELLPAECHRTIRRNLRLAFPGEAAKIVLVTSADDALKNDLKSSLAAGLALSSAGAGRKTLLVDLDLRRPSLHRRFSQVGRNGIADLVRGEIEAKEAVTAGPVAGLDLLPAGEAWSADLVDAESLPQILRSLAQDYDAVVVDASSLAVCNDALVLGAEVDCLICLLECGRTPLAAAERFHGQILQAGIRRTGWVLGSCSPFASSGGSREQS